MKKILLTILLAASITAFIPNKAQADRGCERVFVGYDRCGRPVYSLVERPVYYGRDSDRSYRGRYNDDNYYRPRPFPVMPHAAFTFFFGR